MIPVSDVVLVKYGTFMSIKKRTKTCVHAVNLNMWNVTVKKGRKKKLLFAIIQLHNKSLKARWRVSPEPLQQ